MRRCGSSSGGRFTGGGGQKGRWPGFEGKRAAPVVKWSHAEAMKKKPSGRGDAAVTGDGGGWMRRLEEEEAGLELDGSCWGSWSEAAATRASGTATGGAGKHVRFRPEAEAEAKRERPFDAGEWGGGGGGEVGGDGGEGRMYEWRWTEAVSPEILALILRGRVDADEVARGAARVCRAWREAAAAPDVWGDVDIEAWCRRVNCRPRADAAVRHLVALARGTLRRLSAYRVGDAALAYVAASGKLLNVLQIPMSEISDQAVKKYAECLPALRVLDISNCLKISSSGIEALGRHCKLLVQLKRNMPPPDVPHGYNAVPNVVNDEALAIANTMPVLEHLELAYGLFSDTGLGAILTRCPRLQTLDILGCWNVRLEGDIEERCCALESFREPWEPMYSDCSSTGSDNDDDDEDNDSDN
uniref:F-box domain-containing protein n=1 Tax=Oryza glumipatula TaxID=40148 RepID=A0A0D9ZLF4_9ORYZ